MKVRTDKITIVGNGNVGSHLTKNFISHGLDVRIISDNTFDFSELIDNHLILLCVPDDQIEKVLNELSPDCIVAYTSGSTQLSELPKRDKLGVFYPLQTFTKESELDLREIPFLIEANSEEFAEFLFELGSKLSNKVIYADSSVRKELHLSAVFVNNFTNHIMYLAEKHALDKKVDFELLKPLMRETISKLKHQSPYHAQTGPAKRGDKNTIAIHLESLNGYERKVYEALSESIINTYNKDD